MTLEERRWANGLRQATRTSGVSVPVEPPVVLRNTAMKRPSAEVSRRSENGVALTSLAATSALQTYLSTDTDAQSRIPRPRPVKVAVAKEEAKFTAPSEGRRLRNTNPFQQPEIKLEENARPAHFQTPLDTVAEAIPTSRRDIATRAESPLSRFQKQVKQTRVVPFSKDFRSTKISHKMYSPHRHTSRERDIPKAMTPLGGPSQALTRSLMDKIQEARRLRQIEAPNDHQLKHCWKLGAQDRKRPSNCDFLDDYQIDQANILLNTTTSPPPVLVSLPKRSPAPPIPHAKPVMPAIPRLPSTMSTDKFTEPEQGEGVSRELANESTPVKATLIFNDIITTMKAVRIIQRIWRQKRPSSCRRRNDDALDQNQVTLVVDRANGSERVTPLFSTARLKRQEQQQVSGVPISPTECDVENSTIRDDEDRGVRSQCPGAMAACWPSYDPWMDHELVFLEEGRCIGELQESVRKGALMDQEELVWKRPQHVIQQLEAQRVAMIRKFRMHRRRAPCRQAEFVSNAVAGVGILESVASSMEDTSSPVQMSLPEKTELKNINASKRKLLRISFKHKNASRKMVTCIARRSSRSKKRRFSVRVQRTKESRRDKVNVVSTTKAEEKTPPEALQDELNVDRTRVPPDSSKSNSQLATGTSTINSTDEIDEERLHQNDPTATEAISAILDHFVVFSYSGKTLTKSDTRLPRNDLISVDDLGRSLLCEQHHYQAKDKLAEKHKGLIPLTVLPLLTREIETALHKPVSPKLEIRMATYSTGKRDDDRIDQVGNCVSSDNRSAGNRALESCVDFSDAQPINHPKALECDGFLRAQEHPLILEDNQRTYSDNNSCVDSSSSSCFSWKKIPGEMRPRRNMAGDDPMRALKVMKSAVTETMARIHTEYRHEVVQDDRNQQLEPSPIVPIETTARPRLDGDKRMEFLRVLGDFKRCLRQSSSEPSNQMDGC